MTKLQTAGIFVTFVFAILLFWITGYGYQESKFWLILGLVLAYQAVYGLIQHLNGFIAGRNRGTN